MLFPADSLRKDVHGIVKVRLAQPRSTLLSRAPQCSTHVRQLGYANCRPGPTAATLMTSSWRPAAGKPALRSCVRPLPSFPRFDILKYGAASVLRE